MTRYSCLYFALTISFIMLLQLTDIKAQSAVYVCKETGQWGVAWDDGNAPRMSMEETKKEASKRCYDRGGKDCQLFFSDATKGWYTFFTGGDKGKYVFAIGKSLVSEKESMKKAMDDYLQKGGIIQPGCQTSNWYAPKDAIKGKN
jgi:hypothetical protein